MGGLDCCIPKTGFYVLLIQVQIEIKYSFRIVINGVIHPSSLQLFGEVCVCFYLLAEHLFFQKDIVYTQMLILLVVSCCLVAITNTCPSGPSVILVSLVTIVLVYYFDQSLQCTLPHMDILTKYGIPAKINEHFQKKEIT